MYNLFKHGGIMEEKRRYERLSIKLMLEVSNLFRQDGISLDLENTEIEVFDISKAGIGFMSEAKLPDNYYFNARIQFETSDEVILAVIKILYVCPIGNAGYRYGCEFIGLPSMYDRIFDDYKTIL